MYIGLILTSPSSFQMLRGALIVFTGFLSVAFLGRRLKIFEWLGIFLVLCGLIIVGMYCFPLASLDIHLFNFPVHRPK